MDKRLLNGNEAAKYLGISATTLWRLVSDGKIKRLKLKGRSPRYSVKELEAYIERNLKYN